METRIAAAANEPNIDIVVHRLPPGTCKWNNLVPAKAGIEHRLFCFITQNWGAKPPVSYQVIVDLISATSTETGLKVVCELDTNTYAKRFVVSDTAMEAIHSRP